MKTKRIQHYPTFEETLVKAQRYINTMAGRMGTDYFYNDLQQAGRLGLHFAWTNYDQNNKADFHSYAIQTMKGNMLKQLQAIKHTIYIPVHQQNENHISYRDDITSFIPTVSTNTPIDEECSTIEDMLQADEDEDNSLDDTQTLKLARLRHYLQQLKPKYQRIILLRYTANMTLEDIGDEIGMTKEGARQQLKKAIGELQKMFEIKKGP